MPEQETKSVPELEKEMQNLHAETSIVYELVMSLEDKLSPILKPHPTVVEQPAGKGVVGPRDPDTLLGGEIRKNSDRVFKTAEKVRSIIQNLGL